ncbi:hypothetical protein GUITHDRAFT_111164 [Guillardia theta CCMP2712]|uniref:Uncharacterized protein n=1 Tax=Guillardia theta (strain CCMP2712) TaxID=905079 RepID=L1J3Z9_GUITC|nr:hypothetical protein GUITHDRAFT_111164 [Guillardia theta CCMP2712]EKX42795.1 hypothetical protein GUITHDRAFT_111164 [Guillardia theta CCMP2712]|eukprot:XP_005829775.1 hypothetical protein GUITHDRAFT_111164 [Guillardia theta CCMP2712]
MREERRQEALSKIKEASRVSYDGLEGDASTARTHERNGAKLTAGERRRMLKEGNFDREVLRRTRYDREYQHGRGLVEEQEIQRIVELHGSVLQSKHMEEENQREIERLNAPELDPAFGSRYRGRPTAEDEERLGLLSMMEVNGQARSKEAIDEVEWRVPWAMLTACQLRKVCFRANSQVSMENRKTAEKARSLLLGTSLVCKMSPEELREVSMDQEFHVAVERKEQGLLWTERQRMGTELP